MFVFCQNISLCLWTIWLDRYVTVSRGVLPDICYHTATNLRMWRIPPGVLVILQGWTCLFSPISCHFWLLYQLVPHANRHFWNLKCRNVLFLFSWGQQSSSGDHDRTTNLISPLIRPTSYIHKIFSSLPPLIPKISDEMIRFLFGEGVQWGVDIRGCAWACMWAQPLNLPQRFSSHGSGMRQRLPPRLLRVSVAGAFPKHCKIRNNALCCPMA